MTSNQKITLFFICLSTCLFTIDMGVISISLKHMGGAFSATRTEITWVLTVFTIATAISITSLGFLSKIFGRKNIYLTGIVGFTLSSALCTTANSLEEILFYRALQGAFGATLVALSQAIILDIFSEEHRNRALSFWTLGLLSGPVIGPLLGGYLTEYYGWRWVFFINIPLGIAASIGIYTFMKKDLPQKITSIDLTSFVLLGMSATCLQLILDRGQIEDWYHSKFIVLLMIVLIISFFFFVIRMFNIKKTLIPIELFNDPAYVAGLIFAFLFGVILIPPFVLIPIFLSELSNYPLHLIGLTLCPSGIGGMVSTFFTTKIIKKIGYVKTMMLGLTIYIIVSLDFTLWTPDISNIRIIINGMLRGSAIGIYYVGLAGATYVSLPAVYRTDGAILFQFIRNLGSGIAVAVLITFLEIYSKINYDEINSTFIKGSQQFELLKNLTKDKGINIDKFYILSDIIKKEALMNALINDFYLLALFPMLFFPLMLLFNRKKI